MAARVILVEAQPSRPDTGAAVTVRLAGGGAKRRYHYGGEHWRAGIVGLPQTVASLDFDGAELGGGGVPQAMELRWAPAGSARVAQLAGLYWTDAPITVRIGEEGDALPPIDTAGTVLDASGEGGALAIALADPAASLKKPVIVDRFGGGGGLDGPPELAGHAKGRAWGRVYNRRGLLLDPANAIWCFGDPTRRWQAFDQVRDMGAAASAEALTTLAWAGSAEATFAALQAADAPEGGGVLCPDIACVKWWTSEPGGDLHADIRGEIGAGYVETAPEIAVRIVAARSALAFAAGTVAAAAAARPAPFGVLVDDEATTIATVLSDMLRDVSTSWLLDADGAIVLRPWAWGAPVTAARSFGVERRKVHAPVATRKLGYRRNAAPMARGDLAAIVLARDVAFDDGTTLVDALAEKSRIFIEPSPPPAADSTEDDLWLDSDDGNAAYKRIAGDGEISFGGVVVMFGGTAIELAWTPTDNSRIGDALAAAGVAQLTADGKATGFVMLNAAEPEPVGKRIGDYLLRAYLTPPQIDRWTGASWVPIATYGATSTQASDIQASKDAITRIASDDWLSAGEKPQFAREWKAAQENRNAAVARATGVASAADELAALGVSYTALSAAIAAIPDYANLTVDSSIAGLGIAAKWASFYDAIAALNAAVDAAINVTLDAHGTAIDAAADLAADALAVADGKVEIFDQATPPATADSSEGDRWVNTAEGNREYRRLAGDGEVTFGGIVVTFGGTAIELAWTPASDDRIGRALLDAAGAQATADGKVRTYFTETTPSGQSFGDLWYRPSTKELKRWSGSAWELVSTNGATAAEAAAIAAATAAIVDLVTDVANAQATADGKIDSYYQASPPAGASEGDLWTDTDDANKLYRWTSGAWTLIRDTGIAAAISAAAGAQGTADGKVSTFVGSSAPTATAVGDLWYDTTNAILKRWNGSGWAATADQTAANQITVEGPSALRFLADYTGTLLAGQAPRDVAYRRLRGQTDDTASATWALDAYYGVTLSVTAPGIVTITGLTAATGGYTLRSTIGGVDRRIQVSVVRDDASRPIETGGGGGGGGGGGTTATGTVSVSTNSTSYDALSSTLTCTAGSAGEVALEAYSLEMQAYSSTNPPVFVHGYGKWQWRVPAGTWADVDTEQMSDAAAYYSKLDGYGTSGAISVVMTKTGLTPGDPYEFRLNFRKDSSGAAVSLSFAGSASAVGS